MSIWLQIGAGILPALIILLLYLMIIRKNVVSSLILLFMFTAGLSLCVFHSKLPLSGGSRTASWKAAPAENTDAVKSAQAQADALPADETIRIIYGLAARKQTAEAAGMLKQLIADHGYDASCALAQARISEIGRAHV